MKQQIFQSNSLLVVQNPYLSWIYLNLKFTLLLVRIEMVDYKTPPCKNP